MRILLYSINFTPELTGIGKYTGEMAAWLASHGHHTRVVTAPPYYPDWRVLSGYSAWRYRRETMPVDNGGSINVHRCPLWVPTQPNGAKRLMHLASFSASSLPVMLAQAAWRPDLVFTVEPTLFCAPWALTIARLTGAKAWLHIQDFEVDAAFDLGMLQAPRAQRWALRGEGSLLRRFDRVSTISERMLARLADKGLAAEQRGFFPNWADIQSIHPLPGPSPFRRELELPDDAIVALYAGNLGEKQGLEVLIDAAWQLQNNPRLRFVLAGVGSARARLEQQSANLPNVQWLPLQPVERLNDLLNLADIHLLPQRADAADLVMPSKLTGMLASGRPVVATAAPETQVGRVVAQRGKLAPPGDAAALAQAIVALANDPQQRAYLSRAARAYAERHLDCDAIMTRFVAEAEALIGGNRLSGKDND